MPWITKDEIRINIQQQNMERSIILSLFLWLCLPVTKFINRINWRFGRPYCCTHTQIDLVKNHLQPGMVILTHKKYEFSTMFIPGYWTHSALVVSLGSIVEATGKGVCMNTMESFFSSIDDFIVLRPRFCCKDSMRKAGEHASTLVGSPFSFDFRNSSNEMFYCSGLICWVYTQTLMGIENSLDIPFVLQNFRRGDIIKPMDLYSHQDAWQVMGAATCQSRKSNLSPGAGAIAARQGIFQNRVCIRLQSLASLFSQCRPIPPYFQGSNSPSCHR